MSTRLEQLTEEQKKLLNSARENEKALVNTTSDTNRQTVTDDYNAQISETEQSYNDMYDQNNVQRIINERKIAENMANMGLTDSGLNRTQMTAAQLSYSNNQAKIKRQQQSAIDTLARAMNSQLADIENTRATKLQSIDSSYDQLAANNATSIYNKELEEETEKYKASLDAIANSQKTTDESAKAKADARTVLLGKLADYNISDVNKQALIDDYIYTYGADDNDYTVLKTAGYDIDGKNGYKYFDPKLSSSRITAFQASVMTPREASRVTKEYGSYKNYIDSVLQKWLKEGKLSEDDAAQLIALYGLTS